MQNILIILFEWTGARIDLRIDLFYGNENLFNLAL